MKPATTQVCAPISESNRCRWDGVFAGHFEYWVLSLNDPISQKSLCLRYGLEIPVDSKTPGTAPLFASFQDRVMPERNLVLSKRTSLDAFKADKDSTSIGESKLSSTRARGSIRDGDGHIAWDLRFDSLLESAPHMRGRFAGIAHRVAGIVTPAPSAKFRGEIAVNNEVFRIDEARGHQSHVWGRRAMAKWVWARCSAFEGLEDTTFEGLFAHPVASRMIPALHILLLRHEGQLHRLTRFRTRRRWVRDLGVVSWGFTAVGRSLSLDGRVHCRLRDLADLTLTGPANEPITLESTGVANMKIRLFRRASGLKWRHVETIRSLGTTHIERGVAGRSG